MARKVRVGFVGTGGIANHHAKILEKLGDNEIVAACDIHRGRLDAFAERFEVKKLFEDYRDLVRVQEVEAVSVCTPNGVHMAPTVAALKEGKHVLVEKPIAMNAREGQAMVRAARASKKVFVIGFQRRFSPSAQAVKKAIDEGWLGKILHARCFALRRRGIPSWGVFGRKELNGGGPLIDIGVHTLECAHYLMGKPRPVSASGACFTYMGNKKPQALCSWGQWDYKTYNVEDLASGWIRFENGSTLYLESSFAAHIEEEDSNIILMGTRGGASVDPPKLFTDMAGLMYNLTPTYCGQQDCFEVKMSHWLDCIRTGKLSDSPGEDGWVVQKMLDAIYQSSEKGKEVRIR